nr:hypothetical protein BaRGS_004179 [Batillaria attramentaria]
MNWTDARDACNHDNARLVVLEPLEKADFVMSLLRHNPVLGNTTRSYQIGAARPDGAWDTPFPASGLDYVWQTGIPVDYEATAGYWFSNNFASVDPNQNIVILRAEKDFLWDRKSR